MPLSDHEQRLLEQMERALYAEDPKFADSLRKTRRPVVDRTRIAIGAATVLVGLAALLAGVALSTELLGLIGFVAMVVGAFVIYRAFVGRAEATTESAPETGPTAPSPKSKARRVTDQPSGGGFMDRMEERWRKRRDDRDQF